MIEKLIEINLTIETMCHDNIYMCFHNNNEYDDNDNVFMMNLY